MSGLKVRAFVKPHLPHQAERTGWMLEGMRRHGVADIEVVAGDEPVACDVALFWSAKFPRVMAAQRAAGAHFLLMEDPVWGHVVRGGGKSGGARIAWDGYHGLGDWCGAGVEDRAWVHGYTLQPWRETGGAAIVVFGQVQQDEAARDVGLEDWYRETIAAYRRLCHLPIRFRPHPSPRFRGGPRDVEWDCRPIAEVLAETRIAVTWTTTAACDAICAGVPTVAGHRKSLAWPLAAHEPTMTPPRADRSAWFAALGYVEWTAAEFRAGRVWDHLKSKVA